ncbi:hypothetical protein AMATHDRAFT_51540 [Amanita thiersii Skay4041]|uniref:Nephrocystin 3-like N-terminal domain-containing protein n=1 Tax=Amanita thiersii Skay4041 TaxID=703135 RepID=A0A2A9N6Z6_9AGAR|nr:hypothetical protein AMATHDRAFT_51540 [Amanita thiersii Skay4041]
MTATANACPDIEQLPGTVDIVKTFGYTILEVAMIIMEYVKQKPHGRVVKTPLSPLIVENIDNCVQKCKELMEKFKLRLGITLHKNVKKLFEDIGEEKFYDWLKAPDPSSSLTEADNKHTSGTGTWFLEDPRYSSWKDNNMLLCILGKAGCGKSVLCSSIIYHMQDICKLKNSCAVVYFFDGRHGDQQGKFQDKMICAFIKQLLDQQALMPGILLDDFKRGYKAPVKTLEAAFEHMVTCFNHVYIVIDALDECQEQIKLLNWISKVKDNTKVHLLVTSRDYQHITIQLEGNGGPTESIKLHTLIEMILGCIWIMKYKEWIGMERPKSK